MVDTGDLKSPGFGRAGSSPAAGTSAIAAATAALFWAGAAGAQCVCLKCILPQYTNYHMVSGAMLPALDIGSCAVTRARDGVNAPPEPGDVIAFFEERTQANMIFRVVARAGDVVEMRNGRLWLNGEPATYAPMEPYMQPMEPYGPAGALPRCAEPVPAGGVCEIAQARETLPNGRSHAVLDIEPTALDDTAPVTVPDGHLFVLGDNRDNAADSRMPPPVGRGFVPLEAVRGVFE